MLSPSEAFQIAVPRRPAVLCLKRGEETQLIAVSWFTWLNMRRQPMISYAMERSAALGLDLQENDELYLAFPEPRAVEGFKAGLHARPAPEGQEDEADSRVTSQHGLAGSFFLRALRLCCAAPWPAPITIRSKKCAFSTAILRMHSTSANEKSNITISRRREPSAFSAFCVGGCHALGKFYI